MKSLLNCEVFSIHSKLFNGGFANIANHIDYLHPNIEYIAVFYFYHNRSCICY